MVIDERKHTYTNEIHSTISNYTGSRIKNSRIDIKTKK
jgi:hypothetical protein